MKQILFILMGVIWISFGVNAQDIQLKGTVTDSKGEGLPGVSIMIEGMARGTTSNADGGFSLKAPQKGTLVFRSLGMLTQKVKIGSLSTINVKMEDDASTLDEVVVTSMEQTKKRNEVSFATQSLIGDELAETGRENILNAMQSRVAGATINLTSGAPGASTQIVLRGVNSLSGNNSPLIVLDGLPINNSTLSQGVLASGSSNRDNDFTNRLGDINPSDVESITVLKGPEATALYGIDAGSGAIIIKTKKGQQGKPKISYNNLFRVDQTYLFPEATQTVYGTGLLGNSGTLTRSLLGGRNPEGTPVFDNARNFFQNAITKQHNLSVSGSKGRINYRVSGGLLDQLGTIPNSGLNRKNLTGSLIYKTANEKLTLTARGTFSDSYNQKALRGANGFMQSLLLWPNTDDARNYLKEDGTRELYNEALGLTEAANPYWVVNKNISKDFNTRQIAGLQANYKFTDWLNLDVRVNQDTYQNNGYTIYHPQSNEFLLDRGQLELYDVDFKGYSGLALLRATKQITKEFKLNAMVGTSVDDNKWKYFSERGRGLVRQVVGSEEYIPEIRAITAGTYANSRTLGRDTLRIRRLQGVFGELMASYKNYLTLTVTGRNDWTSTLPASSRSFFYPSAGLSFVFSEILPKNSILTYGKLRGSTAQTAKDIQPYQSQSIYQKQLSSGGGYAYGFTNNNPGIVPERQKTFEVGTELEFFKKRIAIDATYYNTRNLGQIVSLVRLSYGTGFVLSTLNIADTKNTGVELMLTTKNVDAKKFKWTTSFNFNAMKNKVTKLPANVTEYYNSDTFVSGFRNGLVLNGPTTSITGQDYLRNTAGQILIDPGTGNPLVNPNYLVVGDRNPDFTLGINNRFDLNDRFSVSVLFDTRKGGDIMNGTAYSRTLQGQTALTLNRETPIIVPGVLNDGLQNSPTPTPNTIQIVPQFSSYYQDGRLYPGNFMERDVNWVRLRDFTINYKLKKSFAQRLGLEGASLFLTGTDLFILTNYSGADPAATNSNNASTSGVGGSGIDWFTASTPRGIATGIRLDLKVK